MKFSKELLDSCLEVLADKSLSDLNKYEEMEEMLLDEGYDADAIFDLLLALG